MCIDPVDNELSYLEIIHLFVEVRPPLARSSPASAAAGSPRLLMLIHIAGPFVQCLDRYFGNVCELDLVYNFHKVYMILDEFFLSGEIQETSKARIMDRLRAMDAAGGEN